MKPQLLLASVLLAGCSAPVPQTTATPEPARYATPAERLRLAEEARRNFEREREAQRIGAVRTSPSRVAELPQIAEPSGDVVYRSERTRYPQSEARYAMQIGKHPADLTPAERVLAHME